MTSLVILLLDLRFRDRLTFRVQTLKLGDKSRPLRATESAVDLAKKEETTHPVARSIPRDVRKQLLVVLLARCGTHRDGGVDRVRRLGRVPGVDDEGPVERVRGASEFGEDEDSMALFLAGDVLVRDL